MHIKKSNIFEYELVEFKIEQLDGCKKKMHLQKNTTLTQTVKKKTEIMKKINVKKMS